MTPTTLTPGTRLGPYEIVALLGVGGMGEVYRATDTNLKRQVAIKVLPTAVAADSDRLARFQREAEVLAALNHPNIAHIHGLEKSGGALALVMELVEGPTLADQIAQGPIPLEEALPIAKQIAEALEAAHEQGIIHRDLKPANIKVRPDGTVKVLDFGLAKAMDPAGASSANAMNSPTLSMHATQAGIILGTAAYMSPEQARGRTVDKRADIWAFGVVLYEMLTGRKPFDGEDVSSIVASVIRAEPRWDALPQSVRRLLKKCLEKDPARRLRDIGDAWELVDEAPAGTASGSSSWRGIVASAVAVLTTLLIAVVSFLYLRERPPATAELIRFEFPAPDKAVLQKFAVSPDGRKVAFYAMSADGRGSLWIRSLDAVETRRLVADTEPSPSITWSPDSRFLAFPAGDHLQRLMKVEVSGGAPQTVCEITDVIAITGGSWNRDGVIVFGTFGGGVWRVSAAGGTASPVTTVDKSRQETGHSTPVFLPDGNHFLYLRASSLPEHNGVYLGSLDMKLGQPVPTRLVATGFSPVYASSPDPRVGYVLFLRENTLQVQTLDLSTMQMAGEPVVLADHVGSIFEFGYIGASNTDVLAYRSGSAVGAKLLQLTWFDRQGTNLGAAMQPGYYFSLDLSPDAARVAASRMDFGTANSDVWLQEFARNTSTRLTNDKSAVDHPVWSPDGTQVAYASARPGGTAFSRKASSGAGSEDVILQPSGQRVLDDWSKDGRFLLYSQAGSETKSDLWVVPLAGDRTPSVYLNSEFNESQGQFSPDSHWIAYVSDESGRQEIYVQPFPLASKEGAKWTVSNGGGVMPRWRRDGKELFYLTPDLRAVMSVGVSDAPSFKAGVPEPLFKPTAWMALAGLKGFIWDVTPDGKKFLAAAALPDEVSQSPVTVVLNWRTLLKK